MSPINLPYFDLLDSQQREDVINRAESLLLLSIMTLDKPGCTKCNTRLSLQRQAQILTTDPFRQPEKGE